MKICQSSASVKGGAWYPHTVKKIVRLLDVALENRLPVIHICDSAGGFRPLQHGVFPDRYLGGRVFRNQVKLSQANIPQIAVVGGHCTAGGAHVPTLSDYNIIIEGTGAIFLGGPPLVKAATGEEVGVQELGGAVMHTSVSGTGDYRAATEEHAFSLAREIVSQWKLTPKTIIETAAVEEPYYDPKEFYGIIPKDRKTQFDMREVLARIVDGSRFHEYQPDYGTTIVCGFAHIWGYKVEILANNGVLFNDSSLRAAHFMQLCNQNRTPLVFFQNMTGYMVGRECEERGIAKDGAKLTTEEIEAIRQPVLEKYRRDVEAYTSTSELWDDGILDPVDTRNALGMSISASLNAPIDDPHYGIFRL